MKDLATVLVEMATAPDADKQAKATPLSVGITRVDGLCAAVSATATK